MGIFTKTADTIRGYLRKDKEAVALEIAKANTSSSSTGGSYGVGFDILQTYGPEAISQYLKIENDLLTRYVEFENMNEYPLIGRTLDIYADNATAMNSQLNRCVWITSRDKSVEIMLDDLLHRTLRIDEDMWGKARILCMYGNEMSENLVTDQGVQAILQLPVWTMRRIEGMRGELFGYVQDFRGRVGFGMSDYQNILAQRYANTLTPSYMNNSPQNRRSVAFEDWEIVHTRLRSHNPRGIYGRCLAEGTRIWTTEGMKEIQDVHVGDVVFTRDETGSLKTTEVTNTFNNGVRPVYRVKTADKTLILTDNHPLLTPTDSKDGYQWTEVKNLSIGSRILAVSTRSGYEGRMNPEGQIAEEAIVSIDAHGAAKTHDIEVKDASHCFVAEGIVVHNSVLDSSRWIYKRINLLEDAALIYRLQRAPQRYAFYVDVGDTAPGEALAKVQQVRQQMRKSRYINPSTQQLDLKFDAITPIEDFFFATSESRPGSRVEVLNSPQYNSTEDLNFFNDKLLSSLGVPRAYLNYDKSVGKNLLANEDARFGLSVMRIQQELRKGIAQICRVHLAALGIDPSKVDFSVKMESPSTLFALAQMEVMSSRADLATRMKAFVSQHWILSKIFDQSDADIKAIMEDQDKDRERELEIQVNTTKAIGKAQMDIQAQAAPAMGGQPPVAGALPPAPPKQLNSPQAIQQALQSIYSTPRLTEQTLHQGNREDEKIAEDRFNKLMDSNDEFRTNIEDIRGMLREVRAASRYK